MEKELIPAETSAETAETKVSLEGDSAVPKGEQDADGQSVHTTDNSNNSVSDTVQVDTKKSKAEMRAEFERLIKGDYKEFYEERIKENLSRRFRENARIKEQNAQNSEIVELLFDKYNVESIGELKNAIESDNAYLAAQADKRGISIEDYKYIRRLESENKRYMARERQFNAAAKANEAVEKWYSESMTLKESYPEFDIFSEAKNPSFVSLIKSGIDLKTAYEAVHHNELVEKAARDAEKKTTDAIRQRAMRPAENGISSGSSAILKNNVSSLSAKEREEIARRAARGEKITF